MSKTILSPRKQASQIFESLHVAAKSGTLTTVQLSQAVRFVYNDGNTFHCSVGTEWIRNNHVAFATCVGADAEDFFRQHMEIWQLIGVSIHMPELLTIIAPERRTAYVQDVVRKCSLFGWWVKAAFHSGITRTDIAALLLEQIKSSPQREAEYFLVRGAGNLPAEWQPQLLPEDEPWAMFDDNELAEVIRLCVPYASREMFNCRRALTIRLGEVTANLLCEEAAGQLQSALYLTLEQLRPLSLETRLNLARRITLTPGDSATEISAQLICDVILDLAESGYGKRVWMLSDETDELFDKIRWAPTLYQAAHTLGRTVPAWLETWLMDRLTLNGFLVGTLEYGMCQPKDASQPVQQLQLRHGNHIFVQSSRQSHYYCPWERERVIVQPSQARHLTYRDGVHILAAYFTPATRFLP